MHDTRLPVLFMGTPLFARICAEHLSASHEIRICGVVTQPDKKAGRGGLLHPSPVKEWALSQGIPVFQPHSLRKEYGAFIEELAPLGKIAGVVVVAFGQILPKMFLERFPRRCINVHASLLPRWRGANPIQQAILAGDPETGAGLMEMEEGLDTGPVFVESKVTILPNETFGKLRERLAHLGGELLVKHLPSILTGESQAHQQSSYGVTYAEKLKPEDENIDWTKDSTTVMRRIRALWPEPGAHTYLDGQRVRIARATDVSKQHISLVPSSALPQGHLAHRPGTIIACTKEAIIVSCGSGQISLEQVQFPGGKLLSKPDIINGRKLTTSMTFRRDAKRPL